jgi:hypothetical protein
MRSHESQGMQAVRALAEFDITAIPLARILYTLLLVMLISMLGREIFATWRSGKLVLGEFAYYSDGKKDGDHGEQIRGQTKLFYQMILDLIDAATEPRDTFRPLVDEGNREQVYRDRLINFDKNRLPDIDVSIGGVSLRNFVPHIYKMVSPADKEVSASVVADKQMIRAYVSLPEGYRVPSRSSSISDKGPTSFAIAGNSSDPDVAFRTACFLVWSLASDRNNPTFDDFCDWVRLLKVRYELDKRNTRTLGSPDVATDKEFVAEQHRLALQGALDYANLYSSLSAFDEQLKDFLVKVSDDLSLSVGSMADISYMR